MADQFTIKDSGEREGFESGMVRDVETDKLDYTLVVDGPMFDRWVAHLTKGAIKYAARNWMKAQGLIELARFRRSAFRHFRQWLNGETDEDHAAAVFFNINGAEYVKARMAAEDQANQAVHPVESGDPERMRPILKDPVPGRYFPNRREIR